MNSWKPGVHLFCHPPEKNWQIREWLGPGYPVISQQGKHLGERMANAFENRFSAGFKKVLLVGTDIPDLPGSVFDEAFEALEHGSAVIGPTVDGGYYLIGFNHNTFFRDIFEGIAWSTSQVFEQTMKHFAHRHMRIHILPKWRDLDRHEDLAYFMESHTREKSVSVHTMNFIKNLELFSIPSSHE
jgi:rSAM/selenodomain-associated transferase 1